MEQHEAFGRCPICGDDAYMPTEAAEQAKWLREQVAELIELAQSIEKSGAAIKTF